MFKELTKDDAYVSLLRPEYSTIFRMPVRSPYINGPPGSMHRDTDRNEPLNCRTRGGLGGRSPSQNPGEIQGVTDPPKYLSLLNLLSLLRKLGTVVTFPMYAPFIRTFIFVEYDCPEGVWLLTVWA